MSANPLWDLIQTYMDDPKHRYPPKPADLARETGVSEQVISKWKSKPVLPSPLFLMAFSAGTGIPYADLLRAALQGQMYLSPQDGATRIEFSRTFLRVLQSEGPGLVDELRRRAALKVASKPVDLSDLFRMSELDDTLPVAAKEDGLEDSGENSI